MPEKEAAMRFMFKAKFDIEKANDAAKKGAFAEKIKAILEELKPEATYFVAEGGKRTAILIVDMKETSDMARVAEPWFFAFNAKVNFQPLMVPEDFAKAEPFIEGAVKKYG
jgi:hypothetical protein